MIVDIGLCRYHITTDINWKVLKTQAQRDRSRYTVWSRKGDDSIAETPDGFRIHITRTYEVPASWRTSEILADHYAKQVNSYNVTVLEVVRRCRDAIAAQQWAASWVVAHYWDHPEDADTAPAEADSRP